jgi:PKD repeat protein
VHVYAEDGSYEVCLTVSNVNGSHTACDTLIIGLVDAVEAPVIQPDIQLFPNPFQDQVTFVMNDYYPRRAEVVFFTATGQVIHSERLLHGWNTITGINWPAGTYFYEVRDDGRLLASGKVVRL